MNFFYRNNKKIFYNLIIAIVEEVSPGSDNPLQD